MTLQYLLFYREIDRAAAQLELMGLDEAAKELSKERRIELEEISVEMTAEIRSELRRKVPNGEHMRYLWAKVKSGLVWF